MWIARNYKKGLNRKTMPDLLSSLFNIKLDFRVKYISIIIHLMCVIIIKQGFLNLMSYRSKLDSKRVIIY